MAEGAGWPKALAGVRSGIVKISLIMAAVYLLVFLLPRAFDAADYRHFPLIGVLLPERPRDDLVHPRVVARSLRSNRDLQIAHSGSPERRRRDRTKAVSSSRRPDPACTRTCPTST